MNSYNMISKYVHGDIWPQIKKSIYTKYDVIDWIDVLEENLDLDPKLIYYKLFDYKGLEFKHDQRLVIYHRDTDYYYDLNFSGFFLRNLFMVMQNLNISSEYVLLISAYPDIDQESKRLATEFNIPSPHNIYCPFQWCPLPDQVKYFDLNLEKIQKPYVCLNGLQRVHRMYVLSLLKKYDMFDHGMISLGDRYPSYDLPSHSGTKNSSVEIPTNLHFCVCDPPTRINEKLLLSQDQWKILTRWFDTLVSCRSDLITGRPNDHDSTYSSDFLQLALWNVVTETVGDYPHTFITEKTIKAILTKRPFVILGGKSPVHHLKTLGFRTFDQWIDERYDLLPTFADRSQHCLKQLQVFCDYSPKQLINIARDMQKILNHNFNHYINGFGKKSLTNFIKSKL
jgi:hypothetical protein